MGVTATLVAFMAFGPGPTTAAPITVPPVTVTVPPVTVPPVTATVPPATVPPVVTVPPLTSTPATLPPVPVADPHPPGLEGADTRPETGSLPTPPEPTTTPQVGGAPGPEPAPDGAILEGPGRAGRSAERPSALPSRLLRGAAETARELSIPLGLAMTILLFLVVEPFSGKRDRRLSDHALADDDQLGFS